MGQVVSTRTATCPTPRIRTCVGLDLSLTASGIASNRLWSQVVGESGITKLALPDRMAALEKLSHRILNIVGCPDLAVIEVPAFSRSGGGSLERDALWWLVVRSLMRREIPVAEVYNQTRMRYATGKGSARKTAIVEAVTRRWPMFETGGNDNLCDAIVLTAMGAEFLGVPLATVPTTHRLAIDKVNWPEVPIAHESV